MFVVSLLWMYFLGRGNVGVSLLIAGIALFFIGSVVTRYRRSSKSRPGGGAE